jgi:DtxR family Mn-dependent transcriptional regulator
MSNPLSAALEDYLEAIYVLAEDDGARVGDIAEHVGSHKSTVTAALHALAERGMVHYTPYKPVNLSAAGKRAAARVYQRHETLRRFLTEVLGVEKEAAEDAACKMEHVIPPDVINRFTAFADFVQFCPRASFVYSRGGGYFCSEHPEEVDHSRCLEAAPLAGAVGRRGGDREDHSP